MNDLAIRYAVLRDRNHWDESVTWVGLQPQGDGALALIRVPGTADGKPILAPGELEVEPSGLAAGDCQELYVADTAQHRLIRLDNLCSARMILPGAGGSGRGPGQFQSPRGLLLANHNLYVADSGNGRVQVYRLPSLELRAIWTEPLAEPVGLAVDSAGRVYVLDRGLKGVLRFSPFGVLDEGYTVALESPVSLAIDGRDRLYVTDERSDEVACFDEAGQALSPFKGAAPQRPRALAARGERLYVAAEASGQIWVADAAAGEFLGPLADYRGPVAALAVDGTGALHIKPGVDQTCYSLPADTAIVPVGRLTAGPFDAGAGAVWERVQAELDLPGDAYAELRLFTADAAESGPQPSDWGDQTLAPALDVLVAVVTTPGRYLWLHLTLHSDDRRRASPVLRQLQAETTGQSYLDYLPAVYRRDDAPTNFLERWLALFRSELGDLELALEEMPRRFDPLTAPEDHLPWLASWLAFDPPPGLAGGELRSALARLPNLYARRGTPAGLTEFVELYTGVRPALYEAFRERHVWQLGYTSTLDFDTALAAGLPDGMIVPGYTLADPKYFGLRGDYYDGIDFQTHVLSRTDPNVDFDWPDGPPDPALPGDYFSVRWTGQVLPCHSERYTFHVLSDDGVRLWLDGLRLIDQWIDQPPTEHSATIELEAGRWYALQLDYYKKTVGATIKLSWSSRSQIKEIIPQSRLYSLRDETAQLELSPAESEAAGMLVGQTVVGQSGPLEKDDFGLPLYGDTAHLFTVVVPSGVLPAPVQRATLRRVIEAEKPAHTDYHLCFVEARMRVGLQARLGIDSIVAGPPEPLALSGATLGLDSYLGDEADDRPTSRVGRRARLGQDTIIS